MDLVFLNDPNNCEPLIRETLGLLLHYDFDQIPISVEISFSSDPIPGEIDEVGTGGVENGQAFVKLLDTAPFWQVGITAGKSREQRLQFFREIFIHELAHALTFSLSQASQDELAAMFSTTTDTWNDADEWGDRPLEAIAEVFKCAFLPRQHRFLPDRTNIEFPIHRYSDFRRFFRNASFGTGAFVIEDHFTSLDPWFVYREFGTHDTPTIVDGTLLSVVEVQGNIEQTHEDQLSLDSWLNHDLLEAASKVRVPEPMSGDEEASSSISYTALALWGYFDEFEDVSEPAKRSWRAFLRFNEFSGNSEVELLFESFPGLSIFEFEYPRLTVDRSTLALPSPGEFVWLRLLARLPSDEDAGLFYTSLHVQDPFEDPSNPLLELNLPLPMPGDVDEEDKFKYFENADELWTGVFLNLGARELTEIAVDWVRYEQASGGTQAVTMDVPASEIAEQGLSANAIRRRQKHYRGSLARV